VLRSLRPGIFSYVFVASERAITACQGIFNTMQTSVERLDPYVSALAGCQWEQFRFDTAEWNALWWHNPSIPVSMKSIRPSMPLSPGAATG
jgi:hypothetical protein